MAARPERTLTEAEMTIISQEYGFMMEIANDANVLVNRGRDLRPIGYKLAEPEVKQRIESFLDNWLSQDPSFPKFVEISAALKKIIQNIKAHPNRHNIQAFTDTLKELLEEQKKWAPESKDEQELKAIQDKFLELYHGEKEYGDNLDGLYNLSKDYSKAKILGKDYDAIFEQINANYHSSRNFLRKMRHVYKAVNTVKPSRHASPMEKELYDERLVVEYASPREKIKILLLKLNNLFNDNMPKIVDDCIAGAKKGKLVSNRFSDGNIFKKYNKFVMKLQDEFVKAHSELEKKEAIQRSIFQKLDRVSQMPATHPSKYEPHIGEMMKLAGKVGIVPEEREERKADQGFLELTFLDTIKQELKRFSEQMKRASQLQVPASPTVTTPQSAKTPSTPSKASKISTEPSSPSVASSRESVMESKRHERRVSDSKEGVRQDISPRVPAEERKILTAQKAFGPHSPKGGHAPTPKRQEPETHLPKIPSALPRDRKEHKGAEEPQNVPPVQRTKSESLPKQKSVKEEPPLKKGPPPLPEERRKRFLGEQEVERAKQQAEAKENQLPKIPVQHKKPEVPPPPKHKHAIVGRYLRHKYVLDQEAAKDKARGVAPPLPPRKPKGK